MTTSFRYKNNEFWVVGQIDCVSPQGDKLRYSTFFYLRKIPLYRHALYGPNFPPDISAFKWYKKLLCAARVLVMRGYGSA